MRYPSIFTPEYDKSIAVLVFNENKAKHNAVHLTGERKGKWVNYIVNGMVKNITHEYLSNTWGVVESKEHAEFIVELAESAKCTGLEIAKHKIASGQTFKGVCFNFYTDNGVLWFSFHHESQAKNRGEKQITIPIPPKTELPEAGYNLVFAPEQDLKAARNKANELRKNSGCSDELLSKVVDDAKSKLVGVIKDPVAERKEWPCVGDDVLICDKVNLLEQSRFNGKKCRVIGVCVNGDDKVITVTHESCGLAAFNFGDWIKKPKTPEEALRDELWNIICRDSVTGGDAGEILESLLTKYNITPKEV